MLRVQTRPHRPPSPYSLIPSSLPYQLTVPTKALGVKADRGDCACTHIHNVPLASQSHPPALSHQLKVETERWASRLMGEAASGAVAESD